MQDQYQEDDKTGRGETGEQITDKRWERKKLLKKRALRLKLYKAGVLTAVLLVSCAFVAFRYLAGGSRKKQETRALRQEAASEASHSVKQSREDVVAEKPGEEKSADAALFFHGYQPQVTEQTQTMPEGDENMTREYAILFFLDNGGRAEECADENVSGIHDQDFDAVNCSRTDSESERLVYHRSVDYRLCFFPWMQCGELGIKRNGVCVRPDAWNDYAFGSRCGACTVALCGPVVSESGEHRRLHRLCRRESGGSGEREVW